MLRLKAQMKPGSKPSGVLLGLLGLALTGCGADALTASTPLPPLITSSDIPAAVSRNGFLELAVSVAVPGRIPAEMAFQVSWSGIAVQTLSAAQVNCLSGEVSCTTRFSIRPPLGLLPGSYLLSLQAFDRLGQSAVVTKAVLLTD
ncbi:MAG: hypothetical protein Q6K80_02695 [Thermostichus sp. DG_1_6_bins_120]